MSHVQRAVLTQNAAEGWCGMDMTVGGCCRLGLPATQLPAVDLHNVAWRERA